MDTQLPPQQPGNALLRGIGALVVIVVSWVVLTFAAGFFTGFVVWAFKTGWGWGWW